MILFDLGNTLEHDGALLPGALELLEAVSELRDAQGNPVRMGLLSDFHLAQAADDIPVLRASYLAILEGLGIRRFFQPGELSVTLSTDLGVYKPDERLFRLALEKLGGSCFGDVLFITEKLSHVQVARDLGLRAVHFKGPGEVVGDVATLSEFVAIAAEHAAALTWLSTHNQAASKK